MIWVKTKPSQWKRSIGENEAMIKMIGEGGQSLERMSGSYP